MTRVVLALLAALVLGGCGLVGPKSAYVLAHEARLQDTDFMQAYNACNADTAAFGLIPDLGFTHDIKFFRCMEKAGWVQAPRWNRTPSALGFYERVPL